MHGTRLIFEKQLQQIQDEMLELASMVDKAIDASVEALRRRDRKEAERIVAADLLVNRKRYEIEQNCLSLMATQQPMARDLRLIVAVLLIGTELERMGDHAEGIAKITLMLADEPLLKPLVDIPRMAEKAREMLRKSIDSFVSRDAEAAKLLAAEDDEVDALYDQVYRELLTFMIGDPRNITRATHLLWVAHNLERIADRATNICERVVFTVTGRMEEINVSMY
ncbi:MAG: phosphate signaling complex protein PhoU [Chloroflexi bacterium]|nr:phosphate signaling complex protein PhoU [Chloroflexota bacterium]